MAPPLFDIQGHRGCRGLEPENTVPAMIRALDLGVTTLEMDVVISADGQVVVSHEPFFHHELATRPDGRPVSAAEERSLNLYRMTYEQIRSYDVGMKPHPRFPRQQKRPAVKPLLSELIDSVEAYCTRTGRARPWYNIETKSLALTDGIFHPKPEAFVDRLMKVVKEKGIGPRLIVQSFDRRTLQVMHRKHPEVPLALLVEKSPKKELEEWIGELGFRPAIFSPEHTLVDRELVTKAHGRKLRLIPWTVNSRERIDELKAMGVDGIITDYPDLFQRLSSR